MSHRNDNFNFSRRMISSRNYRRYEKAIDLMWNPRDLDYSQDIEDWQKLDDNQREIILRISTKFLAGEQRVAKEGAPVVIGADALGQFDWVMYLSTFLLEECKHAEFLAIWHQRVTGLLEPDEILPHYLERAMTQDPSGRFELKDIVHEGIPHYNRLLLQAVLAGERGEIERSLIRSFLTYNVIAEGVLTMPSYEIMIDTLNVYGGVCPTLRHGFQLILRDEGRHITSATRAIFELIQEHPEYADLVGEIFDEFRGNIVGLVEYQKANTMLDLDKYQTQKVRHYRNRCREMSIPPDQELIDQILDPSIDFVVDLAAG